MLGKRAPTPDEAQRKLPRLLEFVSDTVSWDSSELDSDCFPPLRELRPKARSATHSGNVLLLQGSCGSGKSFRVREFVQQDLLSEDPQASVLFLAANQLYAKNLAAELHTCGFEDAICYLDADRERSIRAQFVVCTLESMHRLDSSPFKLVVVDEVRSIAGLLGGETLNLDRQWKRIECVLRSAGYLIACDAHVGLDDCVRDFLRLAVPQRAVSDVKLTRSKPHLRRDVQILHQFGAEGGKELWFSELKSACERWHEDKERRIAISVGSKNGQLHEVCALLKRMGVPFAAYSGHTGNKKKFEDLEDPDAAWKCVGAVVFTTSLSVGVDPKRVQFARVFMWTSRRACLFRSMVQGAMRFGRSSAAPLLDRTVLVLMDSVSPRVQAIRAAAGKLTLRERPSYERVYAQLRSDRASTAHLMSREERALGRASAASLSDEILRVLAHNVVERENQESQHTREIAERIFAQSGWTVVPSAIELRDHEPRTGLELSEEQELSSMLADQRWEWGFAHILERGAREFLWKRCYGLADDDLLKLTSTTVEKLLLEMFHVLKHLDELPQSAEECVQIREHFDALQMRALQLCRSAESVMHDDSEQRTREKAKSLHPQQKRPLGVRMSLLRDAAAWLGDQALLLHGGELDASVVELVNRSQSGQCTTDDEVQLNRLRQLARDSSATRCAATKPLAALRRVAGNAGFELVVESWRPLVNGVQTVQVSALRLEPLLPHVVQHWLVWSPALKRCVTVRDWKLATADLDYERSEQAMMLQFRDAFASEGPVDSENRRTELLDAAALQEQLQLACSGNDERRRHWLEKANDCAAAEVNGERALTVVYGKTKVIGRRTASVPSMQCCPSGLRAKLVGKRCHDIDIVNCHPTLMRQVCKQARIEVPFLERYVLERDAVLADLAAHYDCTRGQAKLLMLRVLNGGKPEQWRIDERVSVREDHAFVEDMCVEMLRIRQAFFERFAPQLGALQAELHDAWASQEKLRRTTFSHCIFELENAILQIVDSSLRESGWTVRSLIYDGALVDHRDDADLEAALRRAERRVLQETMFEVQLLEKPLFCG